MNSYRVSIVFAEGEKDDSYSTIVIATDIGIAGVKAISGYCIEYNLSTMPKCIEMIVTLLTYTRST